MFSSLGPLLHRVQRTGINREALQTQPRRALCCYIGPERWRRATRCHVEGLDAPQALELRRDLCCTFATGSVVDTLTSASCYDSTRRTILRTDTADMSGPPPSTSECVFLSVLVRIVHWRLDLDRIVAVQDAFSDLRIDVRESQPQQLNQNIHRWGANGNNRRKSVQGGIGAGVGLSNALTSQPAPTLTPSKVQHALRYSSRDSINV